MEAKDPQRLYVGLTGVSQVGGSLRLARALELSRGYM